MSKKKILMLIGDYVEDYEVMVAYQALTARVNDFETGAHEI